MSKILITDSQGRNHKNHIIDGIRIISIPGLSLKKDTHTALISETLKKKEVREVFFLAGGCQRDYFTLLREENGGANKRFQNATTLEFTEEMKSYPAVRSWFQNGGDFRVIYSKVRKDLKTGTATKLLKKNPNGFIHKITNIVEGCTHIKRIYICPVLPWAVDDMGMRVGKALFNKGLSSIIHNSRFRCNGGETKLMYCDIDVLQQFPHNYYVDNSDDPNGVHYTAYFMKNVFITIANS